MIAIPPTPRVLVVVEGIHDVSFLKIASNILHDGDSSLPNLSAMEAERDLVFLPVGGTVTSTWQCRLRPLGLSEFHLYDRDVPPHSEARRAVAAAVNRRLNCCAFVTSRRHIESYLHPMAVRAAGGMPVVFGEDDDVAEVAARAFHRVRGTKDWHRLTANRRRKLRLRAKRWLNTEVVSQMTPELFAEHDPHGEVASWLTRIGEMARR